MNRIAALFLTCSLLATGLFAGTPTLFPPTKAVASGHNIRIKLDNYQETALVLGFYYGEKPYVKDTATVDKDGYFVFKADTLLPPGMYLLVLKPSNNFIQILVPADDQEFTVMGNANDVVDMKFKGSDDNAYFYKYMQMLGKLRPEADTLRKQLEKVKSNPVDSAKLAGKLADLDESVKKYQREFLSKNPNTITAKIMRASIDPDAPDFKGDEKTRNAQFREWWRTHFFDNIDIADPVMLRSPVLHGKIEQYMDKFTVPHPDSINISLDYILGKLKNSPENYKYYLIDFLNKYAKSQIVGQDACYVHLAKNYYCAGGAPWVKSDELEKICDNAKRLEPILIGKTAPNIVVKDRNNKPFALWDVDADYTVVFFWDPECGHCKKSAPFMVEFAKQFKDRGVKVFAMCTAVTDKANDCWKGAEEKGFEDGLFFNYYDPYIQSRYKTLYDVRSTPQIFILDRHHKILMKRIGAEELPKIMEQVMQIEEEKKKESGQKK